MAELEDLKALTDGQSYVEWATDWITDELSEGRTDWLRYGREIESRVPGFSQIIVHGGHPVENHLWQRLVDENQLHRILGRNGLAAL